MCPGCSEAANVGRTQQFAELANNCGCGLTFLMGIVTIRTWATVSATELSQAKQNLYRAGLICYQSHLEVFGILGVYNTMDLVGIRDHNVGKY